MKKKTSNSLVDSELAAKFSLFLIEILQDLSGAALFETAAKSAFLWSDQCLDLFQKVNPEPQPTDCRPGCNSCCFNQVELTVPEVLLMGNYLADRLNDSDLKLLLQRVEESCSLRSGKSSRELAKMRSELPCPLLEEGRCLAYDVRPLMCRAMHALHVETCRQELADPNLNTVEFYLHRHVINVSISKGLVDACKALGYQPGPLDLTQAIRQYFAQPGTVHRWLAGETVFNDI